PLLSSLLFSSFWPLVLSSPPFFSIFISLSPSLSLSLSLSWAFWHSCITGGPTLPPSLSLYLCLCLSLSLSLSLSVSPPSLSLHPCRLVLTFDTGCPEHGSLLPAERLAHFSSSS